MTFSTNIEQSPQTGMRWICLRLMGSLVVTPEVKHPILDTADNCLHLIRRLISEACILSI